MSLGFNVKKYKKSQGQNVKIYIKSQKVMSSSQSGNQFRGVTRTKASDYVHGGK